MADEPTGMNYQQEAPQPAASEVTPGMQYEKIDVSRSIPQDDNRTITIPGGVSEIYGDPLPDREIKVKDLPDAVTAEYLKLFNEGKADEAIASIHQDLIDAGAPEGTLKLAAYLATEYKENQDRPEWRKYAADMTIWLRRAIVAKGGKR